MKKYKKQFKCKNNCYHINILQNHPLCHYTFINVKKLGCPVKKQNISSDTWTRLVTDQYCWHSAESWHRPHINHFSMRADVINQVFKLFAILSSYEQFVSDVGIDFLITHRTWHLKRRLKNKRNVCNALLYKIKNVSDIYLALIQENAWNIKRGPKIHIKPLLILTTTLNILSGVLNISKWCQISLTKMSTNIDNFSSSHSQSRSSLSNQLNYLVNFLTSF